MSFPSFLPATSRHPDLRSDWQTARRIRKDNTTQNNPRSHGGNENEWNKLNLMDEELDSHSRRGDPLPHLGRSQDESEIWKNI